MAEIAAKFGSRVREIRESRELSQERLAHACKMDRTYLSGIERGKRNPALKNISRIAKELGVSLEELFRGLN